MTVLIKEVLSKKDLKVFIKFPHTLYEYNPYWVPPLHFDEMTTLGKTSNPTFEFCKARYWLAYKDDKIVERIAGIINKKSISIWGKKYARFGWIDFIDDEEVSGALLSTVETWAKENGMKGIQGPMGFTDFDKEGMLVEGFNEISTLPTIIKLKAIKRNDTADLYLIAVSEDLEGKGVKAILMNEVNKVFVWNNIAVAEAAPQLETNKKVLAQWEYFENRQHKRRRCFTKIIEQGSLTA